MKKISLLGLVALAACSSHFTPESSTKSASPGGSIEDDGPLAVVTDVPVAATAFAASHVEGRTRPLLVEGTTATEATVSFVALKRDVFRLNDPARELKVKRIEKDALEMTHVRLQQVVGEVPVFGAELTAHYAKDGALVTVDARLVPDAAKVDLVATKTSVEAIQVAHDDLRATDGRFDVARVTEGPSPELVIRAPDGGSPTLAWRIETRGGIDGAPVRMVTFVDAKTGAIVDKYDNIQTVAGSGTGTLSDTKTIEVTQSGGGYSLIDTVRTPNGIRTTSANNTQNIPGTTVTSTSATQWDNAAAVDAHAHAEKVYDFYKTVLGRQGIDGANGALISNVNFGNAYNNAFWDGQQMTYGDGDGRTFREFSAGLDVVAHELTHGVTERSSALVYQNQSGALNEAVSDIFGSFVDHFVKPNPATEWIMGENIAIGQTGRRDMIHPRNGQQPSNMSQLVRTTQDNGGVHTNSGIANNAAYLMTMGGTNDGSSIVVPAGIGFEKAAKVWYRANTTYFQSTTDFAGAARGTQSAARDLQLTQREQDIVECSWIAVGALPGTCKTILPTEPGTPDAGTSGGSAGGAGTGSAGTPGGTAGTPGPVGPDGTPISTGSSGSAGSSETPTADTGGDSSGSGPTKKTRASLAPSASGGGCQAAPNAVDQADVVALVAGVLAAARLRRRRRTA